MALVLADRVRETTTTTGTGSVTLAGAYTGFQTFSSAVGNGNSTYYTIANVASGEWEVGIGSYASGGNLLSRTTVLASSNGGSLVNFGAGVKDAFVTQPAERALYIASAGTGLESKVTAFTNGGIVYASSTSALATGSALTWNGSALAVTGTLSASLNTSALPAGPTGTILQIGQADGVASNITIDQFGGTTGGIMFRRTTGTNAAKTATNLATQATIGFTGYGTTGYSASSRASVSWRTTEAWTDSAQGCSILISATPTGSTTTAAVLTISGSELAVTGALSATGNVTLSGGTANGVAYLNGSKVLTTGSALTYDGTALTSTAGGLIITNAASSLSTTAINFGSLSGGAYINTPSGNTGYLAVAGNGAYSWTSTTHAWLISASEQMRLTSTGLGIGTTAPSTKLHLQDNSAVYIQMTDVGDGASRIGQNGTALTFGVDSANGSTERARIDSSGRFAIAVAGNAYSQDAGLTVNGTGFTRAIYTNINGTASSTHCSFANGNGVVGSISTSGSTTTYSTSSDYRLKNSVTPMTGALAKVSALKPVTYKWNIDGSDGEGFIAHELAEVVPQCVTGEKDALDADGNPKYQGIDTSFLVATLTAAIQELKAEFDAYKALHP